MRQSTYARRVLRALRTAGWTVTGDDVNGPNSPATTEQVMDTLQNVEAVTVYVRHTETGAESFLFFVWQGPDVEYPDGEEILSDYGMKLDALITAATPTDA
jgi:hypothetical protein